MLEEGEVGAGEIEKVADGPGRVTITEIDILLYLSGHPSDQLEGSLRISTAALLTYSPEACEHAAQVSAYFENEEALVNLSHAIGWVLGKYQSSGNRLHAAYRRRTRASERDRDGLSSPAAKAGRR